MLEVGQFAICGEWDGTPIPPGKLRIIMPPLGHVFGAGWHPVTQAALLALPSVIAPGCSFAEIGAGSGILCVAAKLLGAGKCYAIEMDREALAIMPGVFAVNNLTDVEIIDGTFPPEPVDVAFVSISTDFAKDNRGKIAAKRLLVVTDEANVEDWTT